LGSLFGLSPAVSSYLFIAVAMSPVVFYWIFFRARLTPGYFWSLDVAEGPHLWISDGIPSASSSGYFHATASARLRTVEPAGGWKLVYVGRSGEGLLALDYVGERRWFVAPRLGLHARDARTGQIVVTHTQLEADHPELRGSLADSRPVGKVYQPVSGGVQIVGSDGHKWLFELASGRVSAVASTTEKTVTKTRVNGRVTDNEARLGDDRLAELRGDTRQALFIAGRSVGGDWLEPKLVLDLAGDCALGFPSEPAIVVVHRATLDPRSPLLVSKVSLENGAAIWARSHVEWGVKPGWGNRNRPHRRQNPLEEERLTVAR
jgi:hypothetical protein